MAYIGKSHNVGGMKPDVGFYDGSIDGPVSRRDMRRDTYTPANQAARIEKLRGLGTEIVGEEASAAKTAEWHRNRLAAVACFVLRKTNRLEDLRVEAETRGENDLKLLIDGLIERAGK